MSDISQLVFPISMAVLAIGVLIVLTPHLLKASGKVSTMRQRFDWSCPICQRELTIEPDQLNEIDGPEVALIVRDRPDVHRRPMADYRCPNCEAYHVFAMDKTPPEWLMANPFEAQRGSTLCSQCRVPLARPTWPQGAFDGRVDEAPGVDAKHGLTCSRCDSVVCLGCCRDATRNRTKDGSLLCPRCHRGPVETFFYF